jgi:prepilin-type N-terminal cleavage/methylation domain-containing protein
MRFRARAFSAIELLVVMAIILILMSLLFVVIQHVNQMKKIALAKKEVRELCTAAEQYQRDFYQYPPDTAPFPTGVTPDTFVDPESIYKCLKPYYAFKAEKLGGPNKMSFLDPWGRPYQLDAFHMSAGQKIGEPYPAGGDASRKALDIKIWSFGPDGKDMTGSSQFEGKGTQPEDQDNIGSWTE